MPPKPTLLAFDTSAAHCAAALLRDGQIVASAHEDMAKGQAERLMPLLQEVLDAGGVTYQDLDAIGVGIGPGNFTGIRISVAAARGLALSLGVPAVGVSTLEAMGFGQDAPVMCSLDARRDMFYTQTFNCDVARNAGPDLAGFEDIPFPNPKAEMPVIGHRADEIATRTGGPVLAPLYPLAHAIARKAAMHMNDPDLPRPAPLYVRAADAAPPRDPAPILLD